DAHLPRCLHPERHLHRLRRLGAGGAGDLRDLLRLPAPGARAGFRPGRAVTAAMTTTSDTLDRPSAAAPAVRDGCRPSSAGRPTRGGVERPSLLATGILFFKQKSAYELET